MPTPEPTFLTTSEPDAELDSLNFLRQKQWFLAYDSARAGLKQFPQNLNLRHYAARALIAVGASEEAENVLQPPGSPADKDEETLGLLGRIHKTKWQESGRIEDARHCRDVYLRAFESTGGHWTCVNAMTMSWIVGHMLQMRGDAEGAKAEFLTARELAQKALLACDRELSTKSASNRLWALASRAEALLHLNNDAEAIRTFEEFVAAANGDHTLIVPPARQMRLLQGHGFPIPVRVLEILKPPTVIAYSGHMIDKFDRTPPRFTPEMEPEVRRRIDAMLDSLDAKIGFGSAACGADLMFVEALLARDAECHIVLPFAMEDFLRVSVRHGGPEWEERFQRALARATSIGYATDERYMDTEDLFRFTDQIVRSRAYLLARSLGGLPHLVAVYDGSAASAGGGTGDMVSSWRDANRLHLIDLPDPPAHSAPRQPPPKIESAPAINYPAGMTRKIKTLLFADVVNFSKLGEERIPLFMYDFLNEIARRQKELGGAERLVETWGDGIFVVMDHAIPLMRFAVALRDVDFEKLGLPKEMSVRIGLHAGPVFEGINAMTNRVSFYGSHVNRAARIEPITLAGHIYASEPFVSLLTDEQRQQGPDAGRFVSEFLGNIALAKNFGNINVYRVRQSRRAV